MKKALQLVPAMEQGGVETVVCDVNRILVAAGWENVVVSAGGRLAATVVGDGGRHVTMDLKSKNPLTFLSRAAKLRRLLRAERPDAVCAHSRVPAWLFRWAARGLGIRWMTFAHGANSVSRYSAVMTAGDLVLAPSGFIAGYLKAHYRFDAEKLRIVAPAVSARRFDVSALDGDFIRDRRAAWGLGGRRVTMAVGRIAPLKGYDLLIRAFAKLPDGESRRLVIVGAAEEGHGERLAELKALAAELGVADRVVFAGGQDKVAECLTLADVVVSSNARKPESFGLSMAEALAMGRPVVAKAFGGALDVVRDGVDGVLVRESGEGEALAEAFAEAIVRAEALPREGLRAAALERFSPEAMGARLLSAYASLCGDIDAAREKLV